MKYLILLTSLLALATAGFAQTDAQIESAITKVLFGTGRPNNSLGGPPTAALSSGVLALDNKLTLSAGTDGSLLVHNRENGFTHKIVFPAPTANRTTTFPIGGGTVSTSPTTLTYQFTGATYNTVVTQAEPTVGSTVINLPDTADVDVALVLSTLTTNSLSAANSVWMVSNGINMEGATADAFETTISPVDPTADQTWSIPNFAVNAAFVGSTLTTNNVDAANSLWFTSNALKLEGSTADGFEITVSPVDPTADATWSIPNFAVNAAFVGSTLTTNNIDAANSAWFASNSLVWEGATADGFETTVAPSDVTADRTVTLPNASGTVHVSQASTAVSLTADNQAVTPGAATVIQLSSDDGTATNRTFTLSATGAVTGQIYVLIGPATNQCEIADTGIQVLSATWSPTTGDTLTLLFDGTNFTELCRANN